jgi:hypothetical protein
MSGRCSLNHRARVRNQVVGRSAVVRVVIFEALVHILFRVAISSDLVYDVLVYHEILIEVLQGLLLPF